MRSPFRVAFCAFLVIYLSVIHSLEAQSQETNYSSSASLQSGTEEGSENPKPLEDVSVPSMFFGPITPEQAIEHANRLQELRNTDPNVELPPEVPFAPTPQLPPIYSEQTETNETRFFTITPEGVKGYYPPTSAIFYLQHGPLSRQAINEEIASLDKLSMRNIALTFLISPQLSKTLLKFSDVVMQTMLFPNTTSPFAVPTPYPCSTETCINPTFGNGTTAQKGDLTVLHHAGYDYAASVIRENGKNKMWWCSDGLLAPDLIYYAESLTSAPESTWTVGNGGNYVFLGTNHLEDFDGSMTCDPSVIHVGGMYYMYYGGNTLVDTNATCSTPPCGCTGAYPYSQTTRIGVAYSNDGVSWSRLKTGGPVPPGTHVPPILGPKVPCGNSYGVGHPSATFVEGYFYLTFDDDTVGSSQYAIRSVDPSFQTGVEELTGGNTWTPRSAGTSSLSYGYSWLPNTVNLDWAYSQSTREFIVSINGVGDIYTGLGEVAYNPSLGMGGARGDASSIRVFNKALSTQTRPVTHSIAQWIEGPGLIHNSSGGMLTDSNCANLQIRVINPGRDWDDNPRDPSSATDPNMSTNNCEKAYHRFLSATSSNPGADNLKFRECGDLSYEGWDLTSGVSSCRAWTNGLGPRHVDDYDGDGISDPVVWRPTTGVWWTKRSSNGAEIGIQWGLTGDQPIFGADYDGDRIADPAVKRGAGFFVLPSTGVCPNPMVPLLSTNGCYFNSTWGSTDVPLPGDYDGDGLTDMAARSTAGNVRYIPSTGSGCSVGFTPTVYNTKPGCFSLAGGSGDKPLVADYDGDGLTDRSFQSPSVSRISVYPSTGFTAPICSSLNMAFVSPSGPCYTNMSATTDIPITAYFDNDSKTDIMWWTASSGQYFKTWGQSSNGAAPPNFSSPAPYFFQFGLNGDVPLGKQFNNDSLSEPSIYRNIGGAGYWYVNKTSTTAPPANTWVLESGTTNVYKTQWGLGTDKVEGLR